MCPTPTGLFFCRKLSVLLYPHTGYPCTFIPKCILCNLEYVLAEPSGALTNPRAEPSLVLAGAEEAVKTSPQPSTASGGEDVCSDWTGAQGLGGTHCPGPQRATKEQRAHGQTEKCAGGDNQDHRGLVTVHAGTRSTAKGKITEPSAGTDPQASGALELDPRAAVPVRQLSPQPEGGLPDEGGPRGSRPPHG